MKKSFLFLSAILLSFFSTAQKFRYEASLPVVDSTGFYKILLAPELNGRLLAGFADLRLLDSANNEIPYLLRSDNALTTSSVFKEYEIVEKKFLKDSVTILILRNNKSENINNVSLLIRNADVQKTMRLSGSFDRKQWFVLKESELIYSVRSEKDVAEIKLINFPLTNYTFLRIEINDKQSAPLDIIKAGYYESFNVQGSYTELKSNFSVSDSARTKTTWAHVIFPQEMVPDEIEISVAKPERYMRRVNIYYVTAEVKGMKRYFHSSVMLSSESSRRFSLDGGGRAKELWLEIENQDSPPLNISAISCFQLNEFCVAELEKGRQYQFRFGDSALVSPRYDLSYFQSVIFPVSMKELKHGQVRPIMMLPLPEPEKSIFTDKRYIWTVLILVIALLGFVSFRMVRETK